MQNDEHQNTSPVTTIGRAIEDFFGSKPGQKQAHADKPAKSPDWQRGYARGADEGIGLCVTLLKAGNGLNDIVRLLRIVRARAGQPGFSLGDAYRELGTVTIEIERVHAGPLSGKFTTETFETVTKP